jgi:hypothetical protein
MNSSSVRGVATADFLARPVFAGEAGLAARGLPALAPFAAAGPLPGARFAAAGFAAPGTLAATRLPVPALPAPEALPRAVIG